MDMNPRRIDKTIDTAEEIVTEVLRDYRIDAEILTYETNAGHGFNIRVEKSVSKIDTQKKPKYGFNIAITYDQAASASRDISEIIKSEAEQKAQQFRKQASAKMEINGHKLQFYIDNGFYGKDIRTGEEWSLLPKEIEHMEPLYTPGNPEPKAHKDTTVLKDFGEIPYHLKEKMMMYIVGWAQEYTPREWLSQSSPYADYQKI